MGLSTHVLDTYAGCPARGMRVDLYTTSKEGDDVKRQLLGQFCLNAQGRTDQPLFSDGQLKAGTYQLAFHVADYFRAQHVALPEPAFLDVVHLDFGVAEPAAHYHVPLLVTPWAYSTYRGS